METVYDIAMRAADALCPPIAGKKRHRDVDGYREAYQAFERVADPLVTGSDSTGPSISDLLHIRPLMTVVENLGQGQKARHLAFMKPVDPYNQAFSWSPVAAEPAPGLVPYATIKTLHRYAYYGFFKPSIAEVLSQIPAELVGRAVGFTCDGPETSDDLNAELIALDAGFQVATTTLYERAAGT